MWSELTLLHLAVLSHSYAATAALGPAFFLKRKEVKQRTKHWLVWVLYKKLGGGNSNISLFSPILGEDEPILTNIFQMGLKPPTRKSYLLNHFWYKD